MIDQEEEEHYLTTCPINLDKIHCANCYFSRDGICKYEEIIKERDVKDPEHKTLQGR